MAVSKARKGEILEKLSLIAKGAGSKVFVRFGGLSVASATAVRSALRKEGVGYTVAKKTLLKRAFEESAAEGAMPELSGEVAVAYSADQLASSREIYKFQKSLKDKISIAGGVFEGKFVDAATMLAIAMIPGRQVLLGQFVNLINSPIQGLVSALGQVAKKREA